MQIAVSSHAHLKALDAVQKRTPNGMSSILLSSYSINAERTRYFHVPKSHLKKCPISSSEVEKRKRIF